jgi:hypothetical protein
MTRGKSKSEDASQRSVYRRISYDMPGIFGVLGTVCLAFFM